MTEHRPPRSTLVRTAVAAVAALVLVGVPAVAAAHVTVQPSTVEGGGYAAVALRVPNERDDASTTRVRVLLPEDQPLASVQTRPVPGWRVSTRTRELDEPVDLHGSDLSTVVSEVTWTATGDGVGPGQFQDFELSLGPLPESGELVLTTLQTYSSGERVDWNQVAVDDSVEPERPAPVLTLTAPTDAASAPQDVEPAASGGDTGTGTVGPGGSSVVPLALAGAALVVALGALALAWSARRRPSAA